MKKFAWFASAASGLFLLITLLYLSIISFAFHAQNYPQTPPFDAMSAELVGYLSGRLPTLSSLFTQQEALHMIDVLRLFQGGMLLAIVCGVASIFMIWFSHATLGGQKTAYGLRAGMALFAAIVGLMGLWALINFEGWFVSMHQLAFTNDLWLFDPAESMLIQMLPLSFFIRAVRLIGVRFAALSCLLYLFTVVLKIAGRKNAQ